jgi:hypothetical protein
VAHADLRTGSARNPAIGRREARPYSVRACLTLLRYQVDERRGTPVTQMNNTKIQVYLGHPQTNRDEQRALGRLCRDLGRLGIPARIVANVFVGRHGRQLDFIIITPHRTVMCELKGYHYPVVSRPNGEWQQVLPDGSRGSLLGNPFSQATEATYALGDALGQFARDGRLPGLAKRYFPRHIDTVVCMFPAMPKGSAIPSGFRHVRVMGYEELLARLGQPGPRPPLSDAQWEAFIAALGAEPVGEDPEAEREQRAARAALQEYRAALVTGLQRELAPRVPTGVLTVEGPAEEPDLSALLRAGAALTLVGPSGAGKSHLARHTALACARQDMLVLWLEAEAYDINLEATVHEATAPLSARSVSELLEMAVRAGWPAVLVLDAINDCPEGLRARLLGELSALRLRSGLSVLLSAQEPPALPEGLSGPVLELALPDTDQKGAILAAYDAPQLRPFEELFATPYELAIAAACAEEAPVLRSRTQLLDAYVRRMAPGESVRAALRALAWQLHVALRSSLPLSELRVALLAEGACSPETLEAALGTRLVALRHGRVSFRHELLARLLAAEQLLIHSPNEARLNAALTEPRHRPLRGDTLALLSDSKKLRGALAAVDDPDLLIAALDGDLGDLAQATVRAQLEALLEQATRRTIADHARMDVPQGHFDARWRVDPHWSAAQLAGFVALGQTLRTGHFVEPLLALLARTDELARAQTLQLSDAGDPMAVSYTVAATYVVVGAAGDTGLAAGHILQACHDGRFLRPRRGGCRGLAARLVAVAGPHSWGVLYAAALLLADTSDPEDLAAIPDLLSAGYQTGGYHLRLQVLQVAEDSAWRLEGESRSRTEEVLQGLQVQDPGTTTGLVDALAAFDLVSSGRSVADIHDEVGIALNTEDRDRGGRMACGIVSGQWEEQQIVGPYIEAIDALPTEQRSELLLLALEACDTDDLGADWIVRQLGAEPLLGEPVVRSALTRFARAGDPQRWHGAQWGVRAHLAALEACARFSDQPPLRAGEHQPTGAWATVSELLFWLQQDSGHVAGERIEQLWSSLLGRDRPVAGDLLYRLHSAEMISRDDEPCAHARLIAAYPEEACELASWSLSHRHELNSPFRFTDRESRDRYLVELLAQVGNSRSVGLLCGLVDDPVLSDAARAAVRIIETRESS